MVKIQNTEKGESQTVVCGDYRTPCNLGWNQDKEMYTLLVLILFLLVTKENDVYDEY